LSETTKLHDIEFLTLNNYFLLDCDRNYDQCHDWQRRPEGGFSNGQTGDRGKSLKIEILVLLLRNVFDSSKKDFPKTVKSEPGCKARMRKKALRAQLGKVRIGNQ
jgi:hypothetical protein